MIKKILLSTIIVVTTSSQALAYKNWEIQSTSYGTEYKYWCNEGQIIKFSIGHNMSVKITLGYDTIDQFLAAQNCT